MWLVSMLVPGVNFYNLNYTLETGQHQPTKLEIIKMSIGHILHLLFNSLLYTGDFFSNNLFLSCLIKLQIIPIQFNDANSVSQLSCDKMSFLFSKKIGLTQFYQKFKAKMTRISPKLFQKQFSLMPCGRGDCTLYPGIRLMSDLKCCFRKPL